MRNPTTLSKDSPANWPGHVGQAGKPDLLTPPGACRRGRGAGSAVACGLLLLRGAGRTVPAARTAALPAESRDGGRGRPVPAGAGAAAPTAGNGAPGAASAAPTGRVES